MQIYVIRLLRVRTVGNSPSCLFKQLYEVHSEEWMNRTVTRCLTVANSKNMPGFLKPEHKQPPQPKNPPNYKWLLTAYSHDIFSQLHKVKGCITSVCGSILKMDSTKDVYSSSLGARRCIRSIPVHNYTVTRNRTHLWPDAGCIHRQRPTNIV